MHIVPLTVRQGLGTRREGTDPAPGCPDCLAADSERLLGRMTESVETTVIDRSTEKERVTETVDGRGFVTVDVTVKSTVSATVD